ncbi:DNA translocase FtsK [Shinella curvata]|uniref:DNA translocase FtsK n=1 Tax=Shinella curvata TaxID=1817964 RepID=A0ABT8XA70_9HYPH|nr:DNA translocase FtsK [Shinella curvata]MCJ8055086.1 DNA translocase FtsK [Shinella curvata]MDO6120518.1 DNA translocase FtsK [Shinella curvata]
MRISRTNFYPILETEEQNGEHSPNYSYENNALPDIAPEIEDWHAADEPVANDEAYHPRFRSPALRSYDPGQFSDGSWESHFYMAPNVRFTRTPDKVAAKIEEAAAEEAQRSQSVAETAEQPVEAAQPVLTPQLSQAELLQRLREALEDRRRRSEEQRAEAAAAAPAPAEPAPPLVQAVVAAGTTGTPADAAVVFKPSAPIAPRLAAPAVAAANPAVKADVRAAIAGFANLSDHAFWETFVPDEDAVEVRAKPAVVATVVRMPLPTPAPIVVPPAPMPAAETREEPSSIASLFRVVECRPATARSIIAEAVVIVPEVKVEPAAIAPSPVVETVAEVVLPVFEFKPTPAAAVSPVALAEPVREMPSSVLSRAKPFQVTLATPAGDTYEYPPRDLLQEPPRTVGFVLTQEQLEQNAGLLESVLEDFGVRGEIIHVRPGPVVTLYEFEPAPGVKSSRVIGLADDIARSMSALSARVAVVPGRNVIGIELPNQTRETVYFREMIESQDFARTGFKLPLCLGKTIGGEPVIAELAKMPHLLVAGTTGSGKSVAINTMILSLLYRFRPEECRLIMVDPKMLELSIYDGIPHLLTPVVTDPKKAVMALKWAVREMEDRYRKMSRLGVRNIDGYNTRVAAARDKGETISISVQTGFDKGTGEAINEEQELSLEPMPYIVVIVDEMADLMMVAGKEIEGAIQRLAQMARAAGIHLIMATQRPSVDVITGTIKANFPTRISFQVTSKIDSRTILGEQGAEQLLGQGDMLHMAGGGRISRVHGPFVSDEEVEKVVLHLKAQGRPEYLETVTADEEEEEEEKPAAGGAVFDKGDIAAEDGDDLYEKAVKVVLRDRKCSTSYIQRRLAVGYNRAASLVERMEKEGLVGPANHVGKREIISGERGSFQAPEPAEDD